MKYYHMIVQYPGDKDGSYSRREYINPHQGSAPPGYICVGVCGYHEKPREVQYPCRTVFIMQFVVNLREPNHVTGARQKEKLKIHNKGERIMTRLDRYEIEATKALYPAGTRIEIICMGDDPRPIAPGTKGTVRVVDDIGTVHCNFDNGRRLGLIPGIDAFRKIATKGE